MSDRPKSVEPPIQAYTFDQIEEAFAATAPGSVGVLIAELGGRGHLSAADVVRASEALHTTIAKVRPDQTLIIAIGGFADDPRELWQIRDVATFLRRVMRQAGIMDHTHPAVRMFDESTIALLVLCGVFGDNPPYRVISDKDAPLPPMDRRHHRD